MSFFTPKEPFTHRARFYGIPCYVDIGGDGNFTVAGTNIVFDWMVLHVCPWIHFVREHVCAWRDGADFEPMGFPFEIREQLHAEL